MSDQARRETDLLAATADDQDEDGLDERATEALLERPIALFSGSGPGASGAPVDLGHHLQAAVAEEVERREGEWSAFTAAVMWRVDQEDRADERMSLDARAIAVLSEEIDAELASMAPMFERAFRAGVEQRIWQAAKERPGLWTRLRAWAEPRPPAWLTGGRGAWAGVGLATAAAGLVGLLFLADLRQGGDAAVVAEGVTVDGVSFEEGTVTVMPDDGFTVVWLADSAPS